MENILQWFVILPIAGFVASLFVPKKKEATMSVVTLGTIGLHAVTLSAFIIHWMMNDRPTLDAKHAVLYRSGTMEIFIDFFFDRITATYALVGSLLTFIVTSFSRYYMHREEGYKRYFTTLLLFFAGYNILILSGNFETFFVGWEVLGVCSLILIGFYRDRFLPAKNALKVVSVFRLGDLCIMLAMWISHHMWHENITFMKLTTATAFIQENQPMVFGISLLILVAAAAKSALVPFSSWLPRAMEGPTTSSAIFYGSLSVHLGAFLLMRTAPYWETSPALKLVILVSGVITGLVATGIAHVQSTVKAQIGYASVAQIGIIFVEIALGYHGLALVHFAANAFLRTYQLLVSPSVLSYLVHDQFYHFSPASNRVSPAFQNIRNALYVLCIKEWNLDAFLRMALWNPFKAVGNALGFLSGKWPLRILVSTSFLGLAGFAGTDGTEERMLQPLVYVFGALAVMLVLRGFSERGDAKRAWVLLFAGQFFTMLSVAMNQSSAFVEIFSLMCGTIVAFVVGYVCLSKTEALDQEIELNRYHGYAQEQSGLSILFLLSCLGLVAFPLTPAFIGVDVMFNHVGIDQWPLIALVSLSFAFIEPAAFRIYSRVYLGLHKKTHHAVPFRSS